MLPIMRWWLPVMLTGLWACGDGLAAPDAAAPPDAAGGLVRITFASEFGAPGGQQVYFQAADGSLVLATRTAVDGTASAWMEPGGFVTVVEERGGFRSMFTHADVQPGVPLAINQPPTPASEARTFKVVLPPLPRPYLLWTPCGGPFDVRDADLGPTELVVFGCPPVSDLLVTVQGTDEYLFEAAVPLTGTVSFTGPLAVAVRPTVEVRGLPASVPSLLISQALAAGENITSPMASVSVALTDGEATAQLEPALPLPAGSTLRTELSPAPFENPPPGIGTFPYVIDWRPATETLALDVEAVAVRALTSSPSYDPRTRSVRWTEAATGRAPDGVFVNLGWTEFATGISMTWHISAPRGEEAVVRLPVLPRDDLTPSADVRLDGLTTYALTGGYAAMRGRLQRFIIGAWPLTGEAGTVAYRQYP